MVREMMINSSFLKYLHGHYISFIILSFLDERSGHIHINIWLRRTLRKIFILSKSANMKDSLNLKKKYKKKEVIQRGSSYDYFCLK